MKSVMLFLLLIVSISAKSQSLSLKQLSQLSLSPFTDINEFLVARGWRYYSKSYDNKNDETHYMYGFFKIDAEKSDTTAFAWYQIVSRNDTMQSFNYQFHNRQLFQEITNYFKTNKIPVKQAVADDEGITTLYSGKKRSYILQTKSNKTNYSPFSFTIILK